jgi:PAS domain S-box-containing protein
MSTVSQFFKQLNYVFVSCDSDAIARGCNHYTTEILGLSKSEVIGYPLINLFHADDKACVTSIFKHCQRGDTKTQIHRLRKADSAYFWCEWHLVMDEDSDDFYFMGSDVSEQKRAKAALESLETVTNTGYWEIDLDTGYLFWSDNVHRIHETDPKTYKPKLEDGLSFYPPDAIDSLMEGLRVLGETGQPYSKDLNFITSKGKQLVVNATGFSEVRDGRTVRNFGTFKDLTKQKQNDIVRQRLEQRVILALKAAKIGVWEFDFESNELTWDDRVFEIYGKDRKTFKGTIDDWMKSVYPDDLETAKAALDQAVMDFSYFDHTFRVLTDDNELRYVHGMAAFIYDGNNKPIKATGINVDLTESETIRNELKATSENAQNNARLAQEMAEKAKAADQQKSTFLANMTHELRTPISGILGLVDLLLTDSNKMQSDAIKTRQYLTLMKSSSEHLLRIVSDILDFSKIEAGKLHIRSESFNIFSVTDNLLKDFHGQALQKGIAFTFTQSGPQELQLKGDPFRLKQVFYNLLGNALKFTQAGSISVDICVNPIGTKSANVECCIKDTGIGISKEDVKLLFMPFEQADASAARQSQGTGLGLAITHELIDLMKGSIKVESKLGEGSCFSFTIPLEIDTTNTDYCPYNVNTSSKISSVSEFEGFTALVAEDNDINQVVIESLLSQIGIVCRLAENGVETLKLLKADDKGDFNFILMDCQMPIMDGFQATKIIRNSPEFSKVRNIPIIALTANALSGDREKCLSAGMDEYLSKPVTATLMRTALLKVLNQSN